MGRIGFINFPLTIPAWKIAPLDERVRRVSRAISNHNSMIEYELSYRGLGGDIQQAHIHVGQAGVNGGISVFVLSPPDTFVYV